MTPMFIVFDIIGMYRVAAFATYDEAEAHRHTLDSGDDMLIETVEEDEDLYHTINR